MPPKRKREANNRLTLPLRLMLASLGMRQLEMLTAKRRKKLMKVSLSHSRPGPNDVRS